MSSATLRDIINKLPPSDRATTERLGEIFARSDERVYTADRLYDLASPTSMASLVRILFELVSNGIVDTVVTVEAPGGGGVKDYGSIDEVPDEVDDWRSGGRIQVDPSNIRVYYRSPRGG